MFYTDITDTSWQAELLDVLEENKEQTLLHPECLSLTTVVSARGNRYHFINTEAILEGDYSDQDGHIQTLMDAGDVEVTIVSTMFYPQTPEQHPVPEPGDGFFYQKLIGLHPNNARAVVPGWAGVMENGRAMVNFKPLAVVTPPQRTGQ